MGCNISTHPRVIPQRPEIKVDRLKSIQTASPTSASKTTANSPHHDSQPRPASSGNSNPASQNWSGVTFGALDVAKEDYSWRNMRSPSIGMRLSCNGDLTKRRDSPDPSPLLEGSHQPFYELLPVITFSSDPVVNFRQSERFLTVGKKSEFFNEMMSNSKGLLKLNTCSEALQVGLSNEKLEADEKTFPKSMDDIQTCTNLLVVTESEIRPGTPAFKPASSNMSSHPALEEEEEQQSLRRHPSPLPQEDGTLQIRQENSRETKLAGHTLSNQASSYKDKEQNHEDKNSALLQEKIKISENNKVQLGKMFTQNLLDLVSPKKPKTNIKTPKKSESNATPLEKAKRQSTDFGDDLSLSLISNVQAAFEIKKGSGEDKSQVKQKGKIGPLGLNKIGLFGNDEMISPINNNARQDNSGYVTPPFLNQTSFMKHIFGEGEGPGEKINTNNENFSRVDFEKYSFLAEVKEIEQNASYSEISSRPIRRPISSNKPLKATITNHNE